MIRRLLVNQKYREKVAVIEDGKEIRYIDLLRRAWGIQSLLYEEQQKNVAILLPNGSDYIAALWGTIHIGMIAVPLNIFMTEHEILPLLKQASVNVIITETAYGHLLKEISKSLSLKIIFIDIAISDENNLGRTGNCESLNAFEHSEIDEDNVMLMLATSGTTGKSKIVQLSERNIRTAVLGYLDKLRLDEKNIKYTLVVPFSSAYGIMILSACLMQSFPIIILDNTFTLDSLYRMTEKYKITHYEGSSSIILLMEQMADRINPYDIRTLKYFGFGGSKVSGNIIEKLRRTYHNAEFYQGYGMTEAAPLITKHPQERIKKVESVGTAIKGIELAVDVDDGIINTPYTKGEILVRGANITQGYFENEIETNKILRNGYLYTGDIGYFDDEGYLYICGRKKNIIIVRGFNVYPEEVEACIQNSGLVKDCFVYSRSNGSENEIVCADIVPIDSQLREETIRAYCNEHLAEYKIPQNILLCKYIRKNLSGKIKRG